MKSILDTKYRSSDELLSQKLEKPIFADEALAELKQSVYAALETYFNVHRGSGYKSIASIHLYEKARNIILEYLRLYKNKYVLIFCTRRRAKNRSPRPRLLKGLKPVHLRLSTSSRLQKHCF